MWSERIGKNADASALCNLFPYSWQIYSIGLMLTLYRVTYS
jgi:hypothetical protein